ncbi:MAG: 50S ribosomal protein L31 [Patescibacteria group bacterium]
MKKGIHPKYFKNAVQHCACGNVFHIPSTEEKTDVEICSSCHPFYTGKTKIVDATGQVEKFKKRAAKSEKMKKPTKRTKKTNVSKKK